MKIAVLGAGVSGLTAARKLHDNGIDVTVFEKTILPEVQQEQDLQTDICTTLMAVIFLIQSILK